MTQGPRLRHGPELKLARRGAPLDAAPLALLALALIAVAQLLGATPVRAESRPARRGLRSYAGHGVRFEHPASWTVREQVHDDERPR